MTRWQAHVRRWGWPLPAAAAALVAASLLAFVATPRWEADADTLRAEVRALRQAPRPAAAPYDDWPPAQRSSDRIASLQEAALREGVQVRRSQQRLEAVSGQPLQVLRLQQAAAGRYGELRQHLAQVLATDPALGLERLRLQRPDAATPQLEADLQWVLLQRTGTAAR